MLYKIFIGLAVVAAAVGLLVENYALPNEKIVRIAINSGDTFVSLASSVGIATSTAQAILEGSKKVYDLSSIRAGKEMAIVFSLADGALKEISYDVDSENKFIATSAPDGSWSAELKPILYEVAERNIEGTIETSLYEVFLKNNWDIRLGLSLAEIFAWQIDFAADIQKGDSFKVIFEERYLDRQYVMPGKILAAKFNNAGEEFVGYYFKGEKTKEGFYDADGNSLQKEFLKSPLQYKYISSGFSYARVNPITKKVSPHRGIDYAANAGTPAVAVGDGTVTQAGWNGYYGISVTVRHNDTYRTVYGHFQSLARGIKVGAKVKQGQVVGYVGSTGQATGPHLHYEMHKFDSYVNPFKVEIPPGEPIAEEDKEKFEILKKQFAL